jgi:cobaltochelatase CobN
MLAIVVPPSILPDISPTRGEIGKALAPCLLHTSLPADILTSRWKLRPGHGSISPLEGEMLGRPEGGVTASDRGALQ